MTGAGAMGEEVISKVSGKPKKKDVIRELCKLAFGRTNDAVKLVFTCEDGMDAVDGLDLSLLSEVKRGSGGSIEIKLINRLEALSLLTKLLEPAQEAGGESARALFHAMDEAASRAGEA